VGLGLCRLRRFFNRSGGGGKGAVPLLLPYSLPPLLNSTSQLSLRLPEESGSTFSLHHHQQPLNHPNLHLTSRVDCSCFFGSFRSEFCVSFVDGVWRLWIRFWIAFAKHGCGGWVEVCSGHRLGRLGSGRSRGRGGQRM